MKNAQKSSNSSATSEQSLPDSITLMDNSDELMDELSEVLVHEAFYQFDEDEPVRFAFVAGGEISITLKADQVDNPTVEFRDGKGKLFRIFLKPSDGVQQTDI
jgi:hypothetical protein